MHEPTYWRTHAHGKQSVYDIVQDSSGVSTNKVSCESRVC